MADDRQLRIRMLLEAGDRVTRPLRQMAGGARETSAALKGTRDRLKDLERAQSDVGAFRQLKMGLRTTEAAMTQAQSRVTALGREIGQTANPTRTMTRAFATARREAEQLQHQHESETRQVGELRDRLRAAGVETTSLARHERELRQSIEGTNRELIEQTRRLGAADDRARRFAAGRDRFAKVQGAATGLAAGGAAAIGTGMALAAPVIGSVKSAQDYQSVMTDIAQKANLTRVEADHLGKQLLVNARAANQMPAAMQTGVDTLAGFGASVPDAVAMMRPIGRAATAYKAEIGDLAAAAFAVTDNLKVPAAETARVIEMMAQAGKAGAFEVKDMATYFPALTAAYQGLGQKGVNAAGDLAAALQITRKGAGDSASAAGNLSNVLQKMASPDTIKNFAKFGIDLPKALKKAYQDGKTPIEAIAELTNTALGGTDTRIGNLDKLGFIFGDAQVQQGLRPLIQNMAEFRRIRDEAQGAGSKGVVDRDFVTRMQDSAEQTRQLQVNAQALGVTLGATLLPTVNRLLGRVNAFANRMSAWAAANPGFAKGLALAAAIFATLFLVLGGGAIVIAGLLSPFAALSFAAGALGIGLLPVIGIAAGVLLAIAAIAGAAYLIYRNWGAITGFFTGVWAQIRAVFAGGLGSIAAMFVNFSPMGLLYAGFAALMNWLGITMPARLSEAGANLIKGLVRGITGKLASVRAAIVGAAKSAIGWFKGALGIRSPSRVFMGLGGYLTQGLAIGIDRGRQAPVDQIRRIASRIIAAGAVTLPTVTMAGAPVANAAIAAERARPASSDQVSRALPRLAAPGLAGLPDLATRSLVETGQAAIATISQPAGRDA
jgi:TP901 family phage tail tape measure protein